MNAEIKFALFKPQSIKLLKTQVSICNSNWKMYVKSFIKNLTQMKYKKSYAI